MIRAAAVILAAGAGRRLGGLNKAALRLPDGRTYIDAILELCRAAGCPAIVVVAEPHGAAVRELAGAATVVWSPTPERGMASSLAVGLAALDAADAALVWPVDHARVLAATVTALLAAGARDRAVVPTFSGRGGHPTLFGATLWPELFASADPDAGGARAVLARDPARVLRLPTDDEGVVRDHDLP